MYVLFPPMLGPAFRRLALLNGTVAVLTNDLKFALAYNAGHVHETCNGDSTINLTLHHLYIIWNEADVILNFGAGMPRVTQYQTASTWCTSINYCVEHRLQNLPFSRTFGFTYGSGAFTET